MLVEVAIKVLNIEGKIGNTSSNNIGNSQVLNKENCHN